MPLVTILVVIFHAFRETRRELRKEVMLRYFGFSTSTFFVPIFILSSPEASLVKILINLSVDE